MTTLETSHISIIIPTLNEENNLAGLLTSLQGYHGLEVIVADGGSVDRTSVIARNYGAKVVTSLAGRGIQLNEGTRNATGNTLIFLHCDTRLPDDFPDRVHTLLNQPGYVAGAFRLKIDANGFPYRIVEWGANLRTRLLGLPYGDQALFVKKKYI